jgi:hypothetical protein
MLSVAFVLISIGAFAQPVTTLTPTVNASQAMFLYNSSRAYTNTATLNVRDDNQWGANSPNRISLSVGKTLFESLRLPHQRTY